MRETTPTCLVQMLTIECSQYVTLFYSALETITHRNGLHMAVLIWNDRVKTAQRYTNSKYIVNTIQPLFFTTGLEMIRYFIEYHKTKQTTYGTSWPLNCFPISFGYFQKKSQRNIYRSFWWYLFMYKLGHVNECDCLAQSACTIHCWRQCALGRQILQMMFKEMTDETFRNNTALHGLNMCPHL